MRSVALHAEGAGHGRVGVRILTRGDELRLEILRFIKANERSASRGTDLGEIAEALDLSLDDVIDHVEILDSQGQVKVTRSIDLGGFAKIRPRGKLVLERANEREEDRVSRAVSTEPARSVTPSAPRLYPSHMEADEALRLIALGEGQNVELKASFAEENEAFESLGAFTNADGGTVFIGVKPDKTIGGADIGRNTLENFTNRLRDNSQPPIYPRVNVLELQEKQVAVATVEPAATGQVHHVHGRALVRVGSTNQVMSPEEYKARLMEGVATDTSGRDRPRFDVTSSGARVLESEFTPNFSVSQFSGDPIADLEWRIIGTRFTMDWRHAEGSALDRTHFTSTFDLTPSSNEPELESDELVFAVRFHWRGLWRQELHRWPITRRELPGKVHWDIKRKLLPPLQIDEDD